MNLLSEIIFFAKEKLAEFDAGHDWSHTERVLTMARNIQIQEGSGDREVIECAAILHDIADTKFHKGNETDGGDIAYQLLVEKGMEEEKADHVRKIINSISFKQSFNKSSIDSIEFRIVQDADRLDAIGAIGIARAFNYGGYRNRPFYDPEVQPVVHSSSESYKKSKSPTLNHFYEKLFLIKDSLHTETARKIGEERNHYMEEYVKRFKQEWTGEI